MGKPPCDPICDPARLVALCATGLLDSPAEASFDRLTRLASRILIAPVALVSLVDLDRQFFKSSVGLPEPWAAARQTPLSHSFCRHVVRTGRPLVVRDAREVPLLRENLAIPDLGVVAYLGIPLVTSDGHVLGSFCAIDVRPRDWTDEEVETISDLAASVATEIEMRLDLARRAKVEAQLRDRQQFIQGILEATPAILFVYGLKDRRILWANGWSLETLGYATDHLTSLDDREILDLFYPEDAPRFVQNHEVLARLEDGELFEVEYRMRHVDGSWRRLRFRKVVLGRDDLGAPDRILGFVDDLTERKEAEDFSRLMFEISSTAHLILDERDGILDCNEAAVKMFGCREKGDILRLHPARFSPERQPDGRLSMEKAPEMDAIARRDGRHRFDWMNCRIDGEPYPCEVTLTPVDVHGRSVILAVMHDLTERKRDEELSRRMFEISSDAHLIFDEVDGILDCNEAALKLLSCSDKAAILGKHPESFSAKFLPDGTPFTANSKEIDATARRDGFLRFDWWAQRFDGQVFPCEVSLTPVEVAGRSVLLVVWHDLTDRKMIEIELLRAKEAAEAASRAKGEFLANMSHEVRTPMAAVLGYSDMLLNPRLLQGDRDQALQAIRRNGSHLLQIINDILDLSKIEAGGMELDLISYSPWQIALEVASALGIRADEGGVTLQTRSVGPLPATATLDPTRVRQILVNLVGNAIKFSESEGRVVLEMGASPGGEGGRACLRIDVEDEGIGMTPTQVERIFLPFQQADTSTTRKFGGTGLGLSISRRLAEAMGGQLTVRSEIGRGSRFTVEIPVEIDEPGDPWIDSKDLAVRPERAETDEDDAAGPVLSGRVLLAEDNPDNQKVLLYHLCRLGLDVVIVENGRLAVEKALRGNYDIVLMDMQMPELDGYGATSSLRLSGFRAPIIALTAHAMREDREKCLGVGCSDYLTKPVEASVLAAAIGRHLGAGRNSLTPGEGKMEARSTDDDDPGLASLIRWFVAALPGRVDRFRSMAAEGDLAGVESLAHQLRGVGGMYGYPELTETAGLIEDAARERRGADLLGDLVEEFAGMVAEIERDMQVG